MDESHQEARLLKQASNSSTDLILSLETNKPINTNNSSAIPNDEFVVVAGEVYQIDIRMSGLSEINEVGIVTTEEIDHFTGKNNKDNDFNSKSSIFIRDLLLLIN